MNKLPAATRLVEHDGQELTLVSEGETLEVMFKDRRDIVIAFSCSPRVAVRAAVFILWRWFVREQWCGLRGWWYARQNRPRR